MIIDDNKLIGNEIPGLRLLPEDHPDIEIHLQVRKVCSLAYLFKIGSAYDVILL